MADSFELKAIITAVDRLSAPLKGMQRQLKGFQKELSGLTVGAGVAGSAILGAIAGASKEAMGLENNMADARKAIEELHDPKAFQKMTNDIVDMSTRLPMAAEGIAEIVAEAGNAGIPFNELTRFAEDATKAAVGFGMTAADAGHQLAVWRTSFKLTQDEVMTLSDQMNYLARLLMRSRSTAKRSLTAFTGFLVRFRRWFMTTKRANSSSVSSVRRKPRRRSFSVKISCRVIPSEASKTVSLSISLPGSDRERTTISARQPSPLLNKKAVTARSPVTVPTQSSKAARRHRRPVKPGVSLSRRSAPRKRAKRLTPFRAGARVTARYGHQI